MRLLFIRHAESVSNTLLNLVGGQANEVPLTAKGIEQAQALAQRLQAESLQFTEIHSSTAVRAAHTCQIVSEGLGYDLDAIQYSETLVEISQGDWTGKLRKEIYTPENLAIIDANPWEFKPPNGESQRDVEERAWGYLEKAVFNKERVDNEVIAVFAHGITIKCIIKKMFSSNPAMTWKINLDNTSITEFHLKELGWFLEKINDSRHLKR